MYNTESLSSAAFGAAAGGQQEGEDDPVPVRAEVDLGGRPSCMVASRNNLLVAVAVGDKVCSRRPFAMCVRACTVCFFSTSASTAPAG